MKNAIKRKVISKILSVDVHKKGIAITTLAVSKLKDITKRLLRESEESMLHDGIPLTDLNSHWGGLEVI